MIGAAQDTAQWKKLCTGSTTIAHVGNKIKAGKVKYLLVFGLLLCTIGALKNFSTSTLHELAAAVISDRILFANLLRL